jgi:hypothetical protein
MGRYAAWGRWDSRTWYLAPAPPLSTSYHIWRSTFLTRTDQSIVHTGNIHGSLGDTMLMELME